MSTQGGQSRTRDRRASRDSPGTTTRGRAQDENQRQQRPANDPSAPANSSTPGGKIRSTVSYVHESSRARLAQAVGRPLAPRELASLAGAPSAATIEVTGSYITAEWQQDGHTYQTAIILTHRETTDFPGEVSDLRGDVGQLTLGDFSFIKDGDPGAPMEAAILANQLPMARKLGIQVISMKGRHGSNDWEHLPQLGFDAPLDQYLKAEMRGGQWAELPSGVHGPTLQNIVSTHEGRQFWHDQGEIHPTLYFRTKVGSQSVRRLNAYRKNGGQ